MTTRDDDFHRRVLDVIGQPVVVVDADRRILYANRAASAVHGWAASDVLDVPTSEILPAMSPSDVGCFEDDLDAGRQWSGHTYLRDRSGVEFPALLTVSPVSDEETGHHDFYVGISADLSDHVALQRRFQRGFESAPHGWAFVHLDGWITEANDAFCQIVGRDRAEVVGCSPAEFMFPEDAARRTPFADMLCDEAPDRFETRKRYRRPDGTTRWADLHVELVRDHLGRPEYFFGTVQDITRWVDATEAAEQAEEGYRALLFAVVGSIGAALEVRDAYTAGHQRRVALLSEAIGRQLGLDESTCEGLGVGAALHDIGKVATPAEILLKPAALDAAECAIVSRHPRAGHDIVSDIEFPWPVATMILQHHERLDGSGYPDGLRGHEICLEARILAVADTVETIVSQRPYRPARPIDEALAIVVDESDRLFDREVVDACVDLFASGFSL
ncbi:MAG: PAS domain S-box protein [Acidimicrobiales bacterium]